MIEWRTPGALAVGDDILVWWPDWLTRRATVTRTTHFGAQRGPRPRPAGEEVWRVDIRLTDGEDRYIDQATYRGHSELVPVVIKPSQADLSGRVKRA